MTRIMMDITGNRYGKLVVQCESDRKNGHRYWYCVCDCGATKDVYQGSLVRNITTSCGCVIKKKMLAGLRTKDNRTKSNPQLYKRWGYMKRRARDRDDCSVCDEWLDYFVFERWALDSGYSVELHLCRNGDEGD